MTLSDDQIERYSRQIILPEVGGRGQERLLAATAVVCGDGAAVSVCAAYLVGAGVGRVVAGGPDVVCDVAVGVGSPVAPPGSAPAVVWASPSPRGVTLFRIGAGGCVDCLRAALDAPTPAGLPAFESLAGSLLATEALRTLLGLAEPGEACRTVFDLDSGAITTSALPARDGCLRCARS